jgi:hypothetical protein
MDASVVHDNHLMRFVPLIPSEFDPAPWAGFAAVELAWSGELHPAWASSGPPVHALHLAPAPWTPALGETAMAALRPRLDPDFLVLPAELPGSRQAWGDFLSVLEGLLELTHGRGIKLALRPAPGAAPELSRHLREVRGEAVGFCWDAALGVDLEPVSDRIFCAVAAPGDDLAPLRDLGYRWNVAVPAPSPGEAGPRLDALERAFPDALFPPHLEASPDSAVRLGPHLEDRP